MPKIRDALEFAEIIFFSLFRTITPGRHLGQNAFQIALSLFKLRPAPHQVRLRLGQLFGHAVKRAGQLPDFIVGFDFGNEIVFTFCDLSGSLQQLIRG